MSLERWSPRAFTGEPIAEAELLTLLEAARRVPSSYNSQRWRFVYAPRDTPSWPRLPDLLVPANQAWAKDASALVVLVSDSLMRRPGTDKNVPSPARSFGFDHDRAFADLNVPEGYRVEAAYAAGRPGDPSRLPEPLRAREHRNGRMPLEGLAFEGGLPARSAG